MLSRIRGSTSRPNSHTVRFEARFPGRNEGDFVDHAVSGAMFSHRLLQIDGQVYACGDGYCTTSGYSWLAIHDRTGAKITTIKMDEATDLENPMIEGVAEVPGKGVFVLVGYQPKKQSGRAEIVRLDGVF